MYRFLFISYEFYIHKKPHQKRHKLKKTYVVYFFINVCAIDFFFWFFVLTLNVLYFKIKKKKKVTESMRNFFKINIFKLKFGLFQL